MNNGINALKKKKSIPLLKVFKHPLDDDSKTKMWKRLLNLWPVRLNIIIDALQTY